MHIADGVFARIDCGVPAQSTDEQLALALPGVCNLHSHGFQRGMAGLTEYRTQQLDSFWTWRELMYRFLAHMTPDMVEAITAYAYMEMLEAGFTRVGEFHYLHHAPDGSAYEDPAELAARVASAADGCGIGLTLLPVFYAHGGFDGADPAPGQKRFVHSLDSYARTYERCRELVRTRPLARLGVAPHSLRAVTRAELRALIALADADPVHIHIAEQQREVEDCQVWSGQRPVEWLLDNAPVDKRFCLVHATHVTNDEVKRIAQSAASVGLCPITEADLGDGLFPAWDFNEAGGSYGVGSDSNVAIGLTAELRLLEYGQRLQRRARNVLARSERHTGRALFEGALRGGAQALGVQAGIAVGAPADVIALDMTSPNFGERRRDYVLDSWIFAGAAHSSGIDRVWAGGVQVVAQGLHRARELITERYRKALAALLQVA